MQNKGVKTRRGDIDKLLAICSNFQIVDFFPLSSLFLSSFDTGVKTTCSFTIENKVRKSKKLIINILKLSEKTKESLYLLHQKIIS